MRSFIACKTDLMHVNKTYLSAYEVVCIDLVSRSCKLLCRKAERAAAFPLRSEAGSAVPVHMSPCRLHTPGPRSVRRSSSIRSRAPSPPDSPSAPVDTWTAPSDRMAHRERTMQKCRVDPIQMLSEYTNLTAWSYCRKSIPQALN